MNLISTLVVLGKKQKEFLTTGVNNSPEVESQLEEILSDDINRVREAYCLLQAVISIQSQLRGPRNFRKLLDEIFQFTKAYSYDRIQAYQQQIVILNITYYQKIFRFSLTLIQKVQAAIILACANIHAFLRNSDQKRLNSVQDTLNQASLLKIHNNYLINVLLLLSAVVMHLKSQHKKAKTILANLLTKIINEKELLNNQPNLQIMAICSYYSYLNLDKVGEQQLGWYYLTKTCEFGRKLEGAGRFVDKIKQIGEHKSFCAVKLTRIENKLEVLKRTKGSWHSKVMKCRIYSSKKPHDVNQVHEELKNIFTIKDSKVTMYKLRKDNLRYLNGEENKLMFNIRKKQQQFVQIQKSRLNLGAGKQISKIEKQITLLKENKEDIKAEYEVLKNKYFNELKQVKVINKYFKTYIRLHDYKKSLYIYNFLYGKMFSKAKIFLLSLFLKRRIKKIKRVARKMKVSFNGILHFVEIFQILDNNTEFIIYRKKQVGFYLKVYPIEGKQQATLIEDEIKLEPHVFQKLLTIPLCYEFQPGEGRLMSWSQYFCRKSFLTIHFVKRFIQRLNKKHKNKQNPEMYKLVNVYLKFNSVVSIYTQLLACFVQVQQGNLLIVTQNKPFRYHGTIYTIGGPKYHNSLYNLTINQTIDFDSGSAIEMMALSSVTDEFMRNCNKRIQAVLMIQKFIKLGYCKKKLKALKNKTKIAVFVQGCDVITYCKYLMGKSFLVAENIFTKDRESMETIMDFNSFQEISLIKDKLSKEKTCKDKLKLTCKYIWTRFFISKLKDHIKSVTVMTDFQISFRNRAIFSKLFNNFIYKRKHVSTNIVFTLSVESLLEFPRPYVLRIFTVHKGPIVVDITTKIYNKDKLFYQKNLEILNKMINIVSRTQIQLISPSEQTEAQWARRRSSRMSQSSRGSRIKLTNSITNLSSDDEIKTSSVEAEIIPKVTCKKTSMLARFRNRRSNQLGMDNLEKASRLASHQNYSRSDLSENGSQN